MENSNLGLDNTLLPIPPYQLRHFYLHESVRGIGFTTGWRQFSFSVLEFSIEGVWKLEQEGESPQFFDSLQVMVIPAGVRHCLTVYAANPNMKSLWLHIGVEMPSGVDVLWGRRMIEPLTPKAEACCRDWMKNLLNCSGSKTLDDHLQANALCFQLASFAVQATVKQAGIDPLEWNNLAPVLSFMRAQMKQNISRADLAKVMNLSETHFHAIFKAKLGVAPMRYLLNLRLSRAQELLLYSSIKIENIANEVGFQCPFHFSRIFKKYLGQSPSSFRTKSLNN